MHVLVIDDEPAVRMILSAAVKKAGYTVDVAQNVTEGAARLVRGDVDLALCDIHMPDGNGLDLVKSIRESGVDTQFIMVTAFASVETAVQALKAGATDYIIKPVNNEELTHRLAQIAAMRGLRDENRALRKLVGSGNTPFYRFSSQAMLDVDRLVSKVAVTDSTVLVTGESGTGKGVYARQLHERSNRAAGPFLPVNCGAIPENLLESEFFGHVKGAFTGADRTRKGLFLQADRGTLFLDEIGELPLHMQAKLLHAIEDKAVRPVGSEEARRVDVRIVAATNRNLEEMVRENRFREDLFFRLSMFHIHIPPLRERLGDIRGLIDYLLAGLTEGSGRKLSLEAEAEELLLGYNWPGNVRQIENVINRAFILADGDRISAADLPSDVTRVTRVSGGTGLAASEGGALRDQVRQFEASLTAKTLEDVKGDRRAAAERLAIGLSSLYRKIDEYADLGLIK
jgi:two-component system, NtrC family, response regulator AtoC